MHSTVSHTSATAVTPASATDTTPATTPGQAPAAALPLPSVHMRVLITWLAVYPSITIVQILLGPSLENLSVPVRVLIITGLVVPVVVYALVPVLLKMRAAILRLRRP
ncbi:hypothetical protein [Streptomyces sp. NBC_01803]|uniref:hypothetical protein n=1 Tax=Streptomyces sp. NBC_01803 TaxID=2975946 RepID=UPI002DD7E626|nr:hypothetical protein [Streptomyces sp. NBC_01803]WSA44269.1 hypothetical protein OIE51_08640 [Streptomyces sp. NBC_01803]